MSEQQQQQQQRTLETGHLDGESQMVLFFITCLLVSLLSRGINQKWNLPYTPLLIVFGIIIGAISVWGQITISNETLYDIHPHGILIIFLPLLIIESSFNAHISILSANMLQVLSLIIPAVVITSILIAVALKVFIGYEDAEMDWWGALVLGSILAATDPVAVVALLKELGAPLHVSTLIEMESLFNDGTAMVFFYIFAKFFEGGTLTIGESIILFLRLSLGGLALGVLFGVGVVVLLTFLKKGSTLFLHILLLTSFTCFYVAENIVQVSGLLAIVGCGLVMNRFMKNMMTIEQVHSSETVLTYLAHLNETTLFFFAGLIIGIELDGSFQSLYATDWGYLFVLYIFVILIRLISILVLSPILYHTGESFNKKEFALCVWGGLRGALGIALALVVYTDKSIENERAKTLILFFTCGVAALTLLINGVTAPMLVEQLQIIQNITVRQYFKSLFMKSVKKEGQRKLDALKYDSSYSMTLWHGVEDIVQFEKIDDERKHIRLFKSSIIYKYKQRQRQQVAQHRFQMLRHLMKYLCDYQHEEYYYKTIFGYIEEAIQQSCEQCYAPIDIIGRCELKLAKFSYLMKFEGIPIIGPISEVLFYYFLEDTFALFVVLHEILNKAIHLEKEYSQKMVREEDILEELRQEQLVVNKRLHEYRQKFSNEIQKLSQQHSAIKVLKNQAHYVDNKIGGLVPEKEGTQLRNLILDDVVRISSVFVARSLQGGKDLLIHTTFQGLLDEEEIQHICQFNQVEHFRKNQEMVSKQDPLMYVILSGEVEERVFKSETEYATLVYGTNKVVGIANSIDSNLQISIIALTDVEAIKVDINIHVNPAFQKFCYQKALPAFLKLYSQHGQIQHMSVFQLEQIAHNSEILLNPTQCMPTHGAFMYNGKFFRVDNKDTYEGPLIIDPLNILLKSFGRSVIVLFKDLLIREIAQRRYSLAGHIEINGVQRKLSVQDQIFELKVNNEE